MSEDDFHKAGFQGSLPILTAKPPYHLLFVKHPYMTMAALILFLLLIGFIKGLFGFAGFHKIGDYGLEQYIYQSKKIKRYQEPDLKKVEVMYDDDGYPIHPDSHERVRVISEKKLFFLNCLFLFFWPCKMCCKVVKRTKKDYYRDIAEDEIDVESDSKKSGTPKKKPGFFGWRSTKPAEDKPPKGDKEGKGFFGKHSAKPSEHKPPKEIKEGPPKEGKGFFGRGHAKPSKDKPSKIDKEGLSKKPKGFFGRHPGKPSEDKPTKEGKLPKEDKPPKEDNSPEHKLPKREKQLKEEKSPKARRGIFGRHHVKPSEDKQLEGPAGKDKDKKEKKLTEPMPSKEDAFVKDKMKKKPPGDSHPKDTETTTGTEATKKQKQDEKADKQQLADETLDVTKGPTVVTRSGRSLSDNVIDTAGPVADPLNKEMERWHKGAERIQAVRK